MMKVFLSYPFQDECEHFASSLASLLKAHDLDVVDGKRLDATSSITEGVENSIKGCDLLIGLLFEGNANRWVHDEIAFAIGAKLEVIVITDGEIELTGLAAEKFRISRTKGDLSVCADLAYTLKKVKESLNAGCIQPREERNYVDKDSTEHRGSHGITSDEYEDLFDIEGYTVQYRTLINDWKTTPCYLQNSNVQIKIVHKQFILDNEFAATQIPPIPFNERCCRLVSYSPEHGRSLSVSIQETNYLDYIKSGEHLDEPFPSDPKITNREAFGKVVEKASGEIWPFEQLTNICGTGLFILTADSKLIIQRLSSSSHVYPNRWTFSASGVMKWGASPDPFRGMVNKCEQEINHQVDNTQLYLVTFGADARKLYFQFGFVEKTESTASKILACSKEESDVHYIDWNLDSIASRLIEDCWEPAAEATLLTICASEFGRGDVLKALHARRAHWERREMRDEWDYRASRPGDLPDMSLRYEFEKLDIESKRYVDAVMEFMGDRVYDKDVVEIGPGTGRITERLLDITEKLTCVEFCERMIQRSYERLGDKFELDRYAITFGQCYFPRPRHDVAVCSLVLVHNVNDEDFRQLVKRLCGMAKTVFVFEDIVPAEPPVRPTSQKTRLREAKGIEDAFIEFGFKKVSERKEVYKLFEDNIAFMEFSAETEA